MVQRQLAVTTDPKAYDETEVNNYNIAKGYDLANDYIKYQSDGGATPTPAFKTLRMLSHDESTKRDVILEEATDQAAPASIYGGVDNLTGNFNGAFRGWDFHESGLLMGIMGYQTPVAYARPGGTGGTSNGYAYELSVVPATLALKIVDNNAKSTAGVGSTRVYRGVGISSAEISLQAKAFAQINCAWVARRVEVFPTGYNSTNEPAGDPAMFYNAVLKWTPEGGSVAAFKCQQFSINLSRPIDTDDYLIGSEFLANLIYNGITDLGGSITLSAADYDKISNTMTGSVSSSVYTLDQGRLEYFGAVSGSSTTVLGNQIPSGQLEILLHSANGDKVVTYILANKCKLTEANASAQGLQKFNKTITWKAQINNTDKFKIAVFDPANNAA